MTYKITLQPIVDTVSTISLRDEWRSGFAQEREVIIDGSNVEAFSASAAQLIIALSNMLKEASGTLKFNRISPSLKNDFILLGLPEFTEELK